MSKLFAPNNIAPLKVNFGAGQYEQSLSGLAIQLQIELREFFRICTGVPMGRSALYLGIQPLESGATICNEFYFAVAAPGLSTPPPSREMQITK
jgi:hypothetical protein